MKTKTKAGRWLRDWREKHNMDVTKCAQICGVSRASISQMESGKQRWSATVTQALLGMMDLQERIQFEHLISEELRERVGKNEKISS